MPLMSIMISYMKNKTLHNLDEMTKVGLPKSMKKDIYVYLIELDWPRLFSFIFLFYILSNAIFAFFYFQDIEHLNNSDFKSYWDAYFFSTQTMAAIGYGVLNPGSMYLNWIVVFQSAFSLISIAAITGIVFAKISKPHAQILFSNKILLSNFNGQRCLSIRIANIRGNNIVEAIVRLSILTKETTLEGHSMRRVYDLKLIRNQTPFFKLSWTIFHVVDQNSPLFDLDLDNSNIITISATIAGHDETYSNTIYSRRDYKVEDVQQNKYFEDIVVEDDEENLILDFSRFHKLKE